MSNRSGAGAQEAVQGIGGGLGENVSAWERPELLISAPGGVTSLTPAHSVMSAGTTASLTAQQDINLSSARNTAIAVQGGMSLFTYGKASDASKPNQETGMQLHAASGNVSVQARQDKLSLVADKAIQVASVSHAITIASPTKVGLFAGGASLVINSSGISLTTSGPAQFKAAMKELTGPGGASASLALSSASKIADCGRAVQGAASAQAGAVALD